MTMHPGKRPCARLLLTVFLVGGLLAPVLHRFTHVHVDEHHHGEAAAHFAADRHAGSGVDFFVEERTPPQELVCDLCARLTLTAMSVDESASEHLIYVSTNRLHHDWLSSRSQLLSRTRAPPAFS